MYKKAALRIELRGRLSLSSRFIVSDAEHGAGKNLQGNASLLCLTIRHVSSDKNAGDEKSFSVH